MKNLRILVVACITSLSIFFNLERLDFGGENFLNFDTTIYLIGFIAVTNIIGIRMPSWISLRLLFGIWAGIYVITKLVLFFFFNGRPFLGGVYTYLSISELALIFFLIWLAYKLTFAMHDFEAAVKDITFVDTNKRIYRLNEVEEQIKAEMFRSRHNQHPLSVVIIEPDVEATKHIPHRIVQEVQQAMISHYVINNLALTLSKHLRRSDMVLEQNKRNRVMIICPETNNADVAKLVSHIQDVVAVQLDITVTCATATFPRDALTFEELVHQAESQIIELSAKEVTTQPIHLENDDQNSSQLKN